MPTPVTFTDTRYSSQQSLVFRATEEESGRVVALKKSRISLRVKRPSLRHESRILRLLQTHPAIPTLYGYGQLPYFEYLAMELLGSSISQPDGTAIAPKTVVAIILQCVNHLKSLIHLLLSYILSFVIAFGP